jgi:hypothetical protein
MAKLTTRDRVWSTALRIASGDVEVDSFYGFGQMDVAAAMDEPPSEKTIRETLQSMAELGHLQVLRQGRYRAPDD